MNRLSAIDPGLHETGADARYDGTEPGPLSARSAGAGSVGTPADFVPGKIVEQACLDKVLEEARLATGATGAAIALVQGAEIICCATAGPDAPDLGTRLDSSKGLSGCCAQTRQLQQCDDTETDSRVDREACRRLGVRSIVVLPLVDSDQLFGIFEVLSSQPAAFGPRDLDRLKILANRILENKLSRAKADATGPKKDLAVDPMQAEHLAREVFLESAQRDARPRKTNKWMVIRTAVVVTVALLTGWALGRAAWRMAVDRAEVKTSTTQDELQSAAPVVSDALPASSSVEKPTLSPEGTASPSEQEPGGIRTEGTMVSDGAAAPTQMLLAVPDTYVLKRVKPEYPKEAKQKHIQGRVVMKVLVGTDGLVRELVVTSGDPQLVSSAAKAVRQWRFRPPSLKGQPIEFETQITVNFALT